MYMYVCTYVHLSLSLYIYIHTYVYIHIPVSERPDTRGGRRMRSATGGRVVFGEASDADELLLSLL